MSQINLNLLKIDAENYPWRAKGVAPKQSHEDDVLLIKATTWFVRCKLI
jgi:hypothetical protein